MALRREPFRAVRGDVHIVFKADTEFAFEVDAGFVRSGHVQRATG